MNIIVLIRNEIESWPWTRRHTEGQREGGALKMVPEMRNLSKY